MLKRFSHFFACLLMVLMPLQALAAANMLVCNSLMQAEASKQAETIKQAVNEMPCHKHVADHAKQPQKQKTACKSHCDTACASLCALTALSNDVKPSFALNNTQTIDFNHQVYASITQPNLHRPPIFLA